MECDPILVVIIGVGPAGLTAALPLARLEVAVQVLEPTASPAEAVDWSALP